MLITQIGKRPLNTRNTDRESYTLSAGIALGIVNLGSGSDLPGMSDLNIDERLIRFVEGGKKMEDLPSMKTAPEQDMCSSVKEGENVNLYVTLPGAIVALALIHLKTNNKQIADRIEIPKTFFALEYSRPSDVLLKVLCKNLIMWDSIDATKDWVISQIPEIIRTIYNEKDIDNVEKKYLTRISIDELDFANIAMLYTYFLTGSLFSIGFKYAGSGNRDVFKFLNKYIEYIIQMNVTNSSKFQANIAHKYTNANKNDIDKRTYQTCLCVAAYAISMVMAGTGDVECFVTLRRIRKILEKDMHYGFNMAIHMSIGFLFLGSGKYTFSTSNLSIAALLMALYPKFPDSASDNKYHLQALRHFYVLAIENRLLQSVDIETGELVSVPLEIEYKQPQENNNFVEECGDSRSVNTPIMLEDIHKISRIHLKDKKYYEIIIDKPNNFTNLQKGSHSVFARASNILDKSEFAQKSVSKMSLISPFDMNTDHQSAGGWIPKMIYVKKCLPIECENSDKALSGKACSSLAPFEFSRRLATLLELKNTEEFDSKEDLNEEEEAEGEGEGDDVKDDTEESVTTSVKLNEVSEILSSITKNPVIRKFLQSMCGYQNVVYSELEPLVVKGMSSPSDPSDYSSYANTVDTDNYFEVMDETEELREELDLKLQKGRLFSKNFYLGILYECFQNNKIEVLPTYIKLFNSSIEYKNIQHLSNLLREGKLISMFYKGLYENNFVNNDATEFEEDDEEMEDVSMLDNKNIQKPSHETLLKKQFIEELEEVMNLYHKEDGSNSLLNQYLAEILLQPQAVGRTTDYEDILKKLEPYLSYKKYPYVSQMLSFLILVETTQDLSTEASSGII